MFCDVIYGTSFAFLHNDAHTYNEEHNYIEEQWWILVKISLKFVPKGTFTQEATSSATGTQHAAVGLAARQ